MPSRLLLKYCKNGDLDKLKILLSVNDNKKKVNIHSNNECAFKRACMYNNLDIVKYLISLAETHGKINIHANNDSAFVTAASLGHVDIMIYLVSLKDEYGGININKFVSGWSHHGTPTSLFDIICISCQMNSIDCIMTNLYDDLLPNQRNVTNALYITYFYKQI